jgi:hypothetical protein
MCIKGCWNNQNTNDYTRRMTKYELHVENRVQDLQNTKQAFYPFNHGVRCAVGVRFLSTNNAYCGFRLVPGNETKSYTNCLYITACGILQNKEMKFSQKLWDTK